MNRKNKIYVGASLVAIGGLYLVISSISKKRLYNKILTAIGGATLNINNYDDWFNPSYYKGYTNGNYILLTEGTVLQLTSIPDGVALSQVSEKFGSKGYGDLRTKISNLNKSEINMIGKLLSEKPSYRQA